MGPKLTGPRPAIAQVEPGKAAQLTPAIGPQSPGPELTPEDKAAKLAAKEERRKAFEASHGGKSSDGNKRSAEKRETVPKEPTTLAGFRKERAAQ